MTEVGDESGSGACPHCRAPLPPGGAECPACGWSSNGRKADAAIIGGEETVLSLLSSANLARMRGQWDEALQKCVEALRVDPGNSTAHSLVGDIYGDQGRREEAIQWYQMALDLDPNNAADRTKLDRLLHPEVTLPPLTRTPGWLRVGIPSALILAFLMMAVGIGALITSRHRTATPVMDPGDPPPLELPPSLRPPNRRPPAGGLPSTAPPPVIPTPTGETLGEAKLRRTLALRPPASGESVRVANVQVDPGTNTATVSVLYQPKEGLDAQQALQVAAEAASQAYRLDSSLQSVKVRVLAPMMGGPAADLALIGVSTRSQASAATTNDGFFSSLWWNPTLFPNPPVGMPPPALSPSPPAVTGEAPLITHPDDLIPGGASQPTPPDAANAPTLP